MRIDAIPIGVNPPHDVNVIIEVPVGGEPIKYEMDKEAGTLVVDRLLYTAMRYPGNYGFIPHTLSGDGDPCDVLIANTRAIAPGAPRGEHDGRQPGQDLGGRASPSHPAHGGVERGRDPARYPGSCCAGRHGPHGPLRLAGPGRWQLEVGPQSHGRTVAHRAAPAPRPAPRGRRSQSARRVTSGAVRIAKADSSPASSGTPTATRTSGSQGIDR